MRSLAILDPFKKSSRAHEHGEEGSRARRYDIAKIGNAVGDMRFGAYAPSILLEATLFKLFLPHYSRAAGKILSILHSTDRNSVSQSDRLQICPTTLQRDRLEICPTGCRYGGCDISNKPPRRDILASPRYLVFMANVTHTFAEICSASDSRYGCFIRNSDPVGRLGILGEQRS
jgi:hypothetical protein